MMSSDANAAYGLAEALRDYEAASQALVDNALDIEDAIRETTKWRGAADYLANAFQFATYARIAAQEASAKPGDRASANRGHESAVLKKEVEAEQHARQLHDEACGELEAAIAMHDGLTKSRQRLIDRARMAEGRVVGLGGKLRPDDGRGFQREIAAAVGIRDRDQRRMPPAPQRPQPAPPSIAIPGNRAAQPGPPRMRWPGAAAAPLAAPRGIVTPKRAP